jgi:hypothetical protein
MTRFDVRPLIGAGPTNFGDSPAVVRRKFGEEFKSFKRTPKSVFPCDYFPRIGVFAYYTASGELEALEFASPAAPLFEGMNFLNMNLNEAKSFLRQKGGALIEDAVSIVAKSVGIGVFASNAKENQAACCDSVIVFAKGYYD